MNFKFITGLIVVLFFAPLLASGCIARDPVLPTLPDPSPTVPTLYPTQPPNLIPEVHLPQINDVDLNRQELPRYESLEIKLALDADYSNPYDVREVSLDGIFKAPDGSEMEVPGFWDGEEAWRFRFTPSQEGEWSYMLRISDHRGTSAPAVGQFRVTSTDLHGWLQLGSWINPDYSSRYFVHHDGTPFYGIGHCDPLNIMADGFSIERGVTLFDNMKAAGENYVVWWPLYNNSPINSSYNQYSLSNLKVIDLVIQDAQKKGIYLIFTIWDHPQLRDSNHSWGTGNWQASNGFRQLGDINSFFTTNEAWAWQENFYRYIIARWGYSPAIGMWQTVSEINGTNAYNNTDIWHSKVNNYFVENDPYRHPTTASMSGDVDWPKGFKIMDVPQVHVYELEKDAIKSAEIISYWTRLMWEREEKPNWIGEFGVLGNLYYPEMFHNSIWSALGSGAAMTPAEWNDRRSWMSMTPEMNAAISRLSRFVADIPLAHLNPLPLDIASSDPEVRGWGIAGKEGGLFWIQDFSLEEKTMEEVRQADFLRQGVLLEIVGLGSGTFLIHPYDTWNGMYLEYFEVSCEEKQACQISLPEFKADMAIKVDRK